MIALALEMTDAEIVEVIIYGVVFLFVITALFVINRMARIGFGSKVRSTLNPFAMSPEDLKKLEAKGQLTAEEAKAVKQAMVRRFMERAKEDEQVRSLPANADLVLQVEAEKKLREAGIDPEPGEEKKP
jgi:polyhydroxyalkanoate synthesis regulator phasin